jgi:hypothetical protein
VNFVNILDVEAVKLSFFNLIAKMNAIIIKDLLNIKYIIYV